MHAKVASLQRAISITRVRCRNLSFWRMSLIEQVHLNGTPRNSKQALNPLRHSSRLLIEKAGTSSHRDYKSRLHDKLTLLNPIAFESVRREQTGSRTIESGIRHFL